MGISVWLEEEMQMKEEWKSVAMKCGEPSGMEDGTVMMLPLFADNLDSIRPIQVCPVCSVATYSMHCWKCLLKYRN